MQFGSYIPPPYPFPDRWWMVANTPQSVQWLQPSIPFQQSYPYSYYQVQQPYIQNQQEVKETTQNSKEAVVAAEITDEGSKFVPTDEVRSMYGN